MTSAMDEMIDTFKLLSDRSRLNILAMLKDGEMCVCEIVELADTTQSNVSQHLKKLKAGGIIRESKHRQWVYYALNVADKPYLNGIIEQLPSFRGQADALNLQCAEADESQPVPPLRFRKPLVQ